MKSRPARNREVMRSTMDDFRTRLDQDLKTAMSRLRQLGAAVAVEERPGAIGDSAVCTINALTAIPKMP